jgi:arylsulfatase A-like enzyme
VLLIAIDDLNDWTGCLQGHPQARTPRIDGLAAAGTLFLNAHCQASVCNPSRASLLTGRYPHRSGIYFLSPDLRQAPALQGVLTLPEAFASHGYRTLAAGKIFHGGDGRFFHEYGGTHGGFGPRPVQKISQPHGHPLWDWGAFPDSDQQMPDVQTARWAVDKLKENFDQPFFLAVGFYRPHVPMYVPARWFDQHPRSSIRLPLTHGDDRDDLSPYAIDLTSLKHVAPSHDWIERAGQWKHAVQSYLASCTFVDHCVGTVLDALNHSAHAGNTIVILFSDHGFHLGEKQRWAKRSLWEDGTRVPLIVAAPGYNAGQRVAQPVQLLDIYPTLLDLAGLPPDPRQQGHSLVPLLEDPAVEWDHPALSAFGPGNFSVRSRRYRFIQYRDGSRELYDHDNDPHEWHNLAAQPAFAEVIRQHATHLPQQPHAVLPGDSTGHRAFQAANQRASIR